MGRYSEVERDLRAVAEEVLKGSGRWLVRLEVVMGRNGHHLVIELGPDGETRPFPPTQGDHQPDCDDHLHYYTDDDQQRRDLDRAVREFLRRWIRE
jgi:hypothetical protein